MGFLKSAWKHGLAREDVDHALSNPVTVHYFDGYIIVVGPSRSGHLIEVGVNDGCNLQTIRVCLVGISVERARILKEEL